MYIIVFRTADLSIVIKLNITALKQEQPALRAWLEF
jgi:hypothetical protein